MASSNSISVLVFSLQQQSADYDSDNTMASNGLPEAFASNELVGERLLIAKPAPPPGLILLKKHAPISQEPQAVFNSQPVFKRATPVRMLGDMVSNFNFSSLPYFNEIICLELIENGKNWILHYYITYSHRCGLQKGRAARRKTLHSHPALSVVNPRITKNFSTQISYRQISQPIELHPAPNILGSKKERIPRPCETQNHYDMERPTTSGPNSHPFFLFD